MCSASARAWIHRLLLFLPLERAPSLWSPRGAHVPASSTGHPEGSKAQQAPAAQLHKPAIKRTVNPRTQM